MQRLPFHRIQRAHELGEIGFEEDPASADLGPGDDSPFGPRTHLFRVHAQKGRRVIETEGSHGVSDVCADVDSFETGSPDFDSAGLYTLRARCEHAGLTCSGRADEQRGR